MFNLESAIAEWRRQMRAAGIKTPVPLEELENHLREEIERQMRSGTDSKLAFESAVQKIGPASALKSEFKKVDADRNERARVLEHKLISIATILWLFVIPFTMCAPVLFFPEVVSRMTSGKQMSCLAAVAAFTLLIWSGRFGYRLFPVIHARRTRDVIKVLSGVFLMLWLFVFVFLILPRCDFTFGPFVAAWYWAAYAPAGVIGGLGMGIETTARKTNAMAVS